MKIDNPFVKVLILWGIVIICFLVFLIAHAYISNYQNFIKPENYVIRAKYYLQQGDTETALREIEQGIDVFRPASAESLSLLKKIKEGKAEKSYLEELEKKYQVANVIEKCYNTTENQIEFDKNILSGGFLSFTLSKNAKINIRAFWKLLVKNTWKCMQSYELTEEQIMNFCYYAGGVFAINSAIGKTGFTINDDLFIISEGAGRGSGAQIWFQGRNYGGNRRGLYVLILTPSPNKVYRSDRFDIWESREAAVRMEHFLDEIPANYIGVFAVADEASENMTEQLEQMLLSFGFSKQTYIQGELKLFGFGYAFAGIGVKGAEERTALQNWAKYESSQDEIPVAICGILKGEEK
ncbi:MAG TPA: interleukin-like EMT inducer domain-containing protein [Candidatus Hydrogenedens sp.]|nr:interleukin-like EMT inducer domain-containing protein [Candidatus Hydrogenedens sp.]